MAVVAMDKEGMTPGRKKALRNAAILALVALAFYAGIFLLVSWRHP